MRYIHPDVLNECRRLRRAGKPIDDIFLYLRDHGGSILDAMKLLREFEGFDLLDAKRFAMMSTVWGDTQQMLADEFERELRESEERGSKPEWK